jgi:hypothetical protein
VADPLATFIAGLDRLSAEFVACRIRHDWSEPRLYRTEFRDARTARPIVEERRVCARCDMRCTVPFTESYIRGRLVLERLGSPHYDQPDGYAIKGTGGTVPGARAFVYGQNYLSQKDDA